MTIRSRLLLGWIGVVACLGTFSVHAASRLRELRDIAVEQRGRHAEAFVTLGDIQLELSDLDRLIRSFLATGDSTLARDVRQGLEAARTQAERVAAIGFDSTASPVVTSLDLLAAELDTVRALVTSGQVQAATARFGRVQARLGTTRGLLAPVVRAIDADSRADLRNAHRISTSGARAALLASLASLVIALGLGAATAQWLIAPIRELRRAMAAVAEDPRSPSHELPLGRRDEIGDLARSFDSMARQLAEAQRVRAEFLSMASHDLKTPLNVIIGYAELLEDGIYGELEPPQREVLAAVREQASLISQQVDELLDASRIDAGGLPIRKEFVDPRQLFGGIERAFRAIARRKGVALSVDLDATVPPTILVDGQRIRDQVLGNLLGNALKFTPAGGQVRVRVWSEVDGLRIDVADTGPGIANDELGRIFRKFYRAGGGTRGAGLGLAIAKEVVDAHGGHVGVGSEPGRGTTFSIRLPT